MRPLLTLFILLGIFAACAKEEEPSESRVAAAKIVPDEDLMETAKRVPGFGGMYFNEAGDLNVYLVQDVKRFSPEAMKKKRAEIKAAVEEVYGKRALLRARAPRSGREDKGLTKQTREITVIQGKYEIAQLAKWRAGIDGVLEIPGVVFTDLDEKQNRLKVGIATGATRGRIDDLMIKMGVPREAVIIEETKPIRFYASLRGKYRPMPGGIQIEGDVGWYSYKICTMGFNAVRSNVSGFVTCSHCTETQGGSEGTDFHQPDESWWSEFWGGSNNKVGDETADPGYFTGGDCPNGRRCRYSDSAFIKYRVSLGHGIARTTGRNDGSLTLSSSSPRLTIVGENSSWIDGNVLDKIGRTTGWSFGCIHGTCLNINVEDSDITMLCQCRVDRLAGQTYTMSDEGDSGSPVFEWLGASAILAGILWGGPDDGSSFVFSTMNQIEQELGPLTTSVPVRMGAVKVAVGLDGYPWIVTSDGAIYGYNGSGWDQEEPPGTADDLAISGIFLTILTRPDSQGHRAVKSRSVFGTTWTTYPAIGALDIKQVACYGNEPVVLAAAPDYGVYKYHDGTQSWICIHEAATEISVMNGYLFYLYPTTARGNVWSRYVNGGSYTRWGEDLVANKIAGDANGYPWVATDATSNPLYKWDTNNHKWTFGFNSGPVYDMDIESYVKMYILSDPQINGGGYSLYSHDLYSGGWTTYSLPSN